MISRPHITCFSRVACSILRATTSTSSAASSRASAPRGFLSPLSNSTGALSVNVMDGILGDVNNAITEWFRFLSLTQRVRSQAPREDPRLSLLLPTQRADEGNLAAAPGVRVRRPRQVRRRSAPGNLPADRGDLQRALRRRRTHLPLVLRAGFRHAGDDARRATHRAADAATAGSGAAAVPERRADRMGRGAQAGDCPRCAAATGDRVAALLEVPGSRSTVNDR